MYIYIYIYYISKCKSPPVRVCKSMQYEMQSF